MRNDSCRIYIPYRACIQDVVKCKKEKNHVVSIGGDAMGSILIKDTTREEREQIIRASLDCGGGCENCSSCWLGGGSPWDIYQDYIDGKREIRDINMSYMQQYRQDRDIKG